ncbi:MAG: 3'-5' exonuclease [Bacteroidales bacterium]|nr:3'-5' exonuclease [Bacteroidales bacterium]
MLEQYNPEKILFLDIETVPLFSSYSELPESEEKFWDKKSSKFRGEEETAADVYSRAGIYAEFGKVICISVGLIIDRSGTYGLRVKSFYGDDEKSLLNDFTDMLNKFSSKSDVYLCAHNGKEFDFPYIIRRLLINGLPVPEILNVPGKKPWEVPFLDTMELWKFGDYKNYTSLDLLAYKFGIPTPKDDIDGSMVGKIYWEDRDLSRIVRYCEKDAITVAQLLLRYKGIQLIAQEKIEYVTD